jgi:hypothetical protein
MRPVRPRMDPQNRRVRAGGVPEVQESLLESAAPDAKTVMR